MTNRIRFVCFVLCVVAPLSAFAQTAPAEEEKGFKFSSLTLSSGEDPISSGITASVRFETDWNAIDFVVQEHQAFSNYVWKFKRGSVSGFTGTTLGHFHGTLQAGVIMFLKVPVAKVFGQEIALRTLQWPGVFAWEPNGWKDDEVPTKKLNVVFGDVGVDVGPVGFTYTKFRLLDEPSNWLLGVSYAHKVSKEFTIVGSATQNHNADKLMLYMGITWAPQRSSP